MTISLDLLLVRPETPTYSFSSTKKPTASTVSAISPKLLGSVSTSNIRSSTIIFPPFKVSDDLVQLSTSYDFDKNQEPNEARSNYRLENDSAQAARRSKVAEARALVIAIKAEVERLDTLISAHSNAKWKTLLAEADAGAANADDLRELAAIKKDQIKFMEPDKKRTTNAKFTTTLSYYLNRIKQDDKLQDKDLIALTTYFYTNNHLSCLPDGSSETLANSKETLIKHLFFDVEEKSTTRDFESYEGWDKTFRAHKLYPVFNRMKPQEIAELIAPASTTGDNPLIREWFLSHPNMWQGANGKIRAAKAMAWVLKHATKVYKEEVDENGKLHGIIDFNKLKAINWTTTLHSYGLKGMLASCPFTNNTVEAIKLGLEELGNQEIAEQLPSYYVSRGHMWSEEYGDGGRLIDEVTDDIIEALREVKPEMFTDDVAGNLNIDETRKFDAWLEVYNATADECLRGSNITTL